MSARRVNRHGLADVRQDRIEAAAVAAAKDEVYAQLRAASFAEGEADAALLDLDETIDAAATRFMLTCDTAVYRYLASMRRAR